jgi:D-3-phosphoglycerate dehydrogenase
MQKYIYVTEPEAIDMTLAKSLLPTDYVLIRGSVNFAGAIPAGCEAVLIRSASKITATIRDRLPDLKHVIRVGTGLDNVDLPFCQEAGIAVYSSPGANADAVSDYVVGMMLQALRKTYLLTKADVETWNRYKFIGHNMAGRRIGIVGFGNIGKKIFHKLINFNCGAFFVYDPFVGAADVPSGATYARTLDDVLKNCDIVTLHVPLVENTKYLLAKHNLGLLPEGAILINASRGGVVNEADIMDYTNKNKLIYIADTIENEPHPSRELLRQSSVIVTPHIASLTEESERDMLMMAIQSFLANK